MRQTTRHLSLGAAFLIISLVFGLVGYRFAGWGWLESIYMVIITIFGVGYGEVQETTPAVKIFTITLILAGCSAYVYIAGAFINWLTEGQLQRALGKRKMAHGIHQLKNHTIVCGYGRIGSTVTKELNDAGKPFVIIEKKPSLVNEIEELGYLCVHGDATEEDVLLEAGLQRAHTLATVLPDDAINVFIVLTARNLISHLNIITRGNHPSSEPKLLQAGADRVLLPEHICAERIAHIIIKPSTRELLEYDLNDPLFLESLTEIGLELEEIPLTKDSPFTGASLGDLEAREKGAFLVIAIRKKSGEMITKPSLETCLEAGDILIVMGHLGMVPQFIRKTPIKRKFSYSGLKLG